ncbi:hypothetical protein LY78DRAFT_708375 [Colletotrichum sublineola]|nr:hypothetical protein LY78DRAFT_708375 [Colletotrichum sublineola]
MDHCVKDQSLAPCDSSWSDVHSEKKEHDCNMAPPPNSGAHKSSRLSQPIPEAEGINTTSQLSVFPDRNKYMRHLINTYPGFDSTVDQAQVWVTNILAFRKQLHRIAVAEICLSGSDLHYLQREWGLQYFEGLGLARSHSMLIVLDIMDAVHAYRVTRLRAHRSNPQKWTHPDPDPDSEANFSTLRVIFVIVITLCVVYTIKSCLAAISSASS